MKQVKYSKDNPYVGKMKCPECEHENYAWRSGGMSMCFPHFYCDTCSNVLLREEDTDKVMRTKPLDEAFIESLTEHLPKCSCGGQFGIKNQPKCSNCNHEFKSKYPFSLERISEPRMILINGAQHLGDNPYQLIIE